VSFEILLVLGIKIKIFCVVTLYNLIDRYVPTFWTIVLPLSLAVQGKQIWMDVVMAGLQGYEQTSRNQVFLKWALLLRVKV
jgi:hypothetical protein